MKITTSKMLANEIKNYRIKQNLTQSEVGKIIGIRQTTVSAFENTPDSTKLETLFKILYALDLELTVTKRGNSNNGWQEEW
ncbi:helix-turn-helix domain-containing protein [Orbaceae bacterium ac157xtp]